jgi:hypothetical protein
MCSLPASSEPSEIPRAACKQPNVDEFFFPVGVLIPSQNGASLDDFVRRWFSKSLQRMGEPSFICEAPSADTYRLLMLPTWGAPVGVRVTLLSTTADVVVKRLSGNGGYDPGTLLAAKTSSLSVDDAARFRNTVADSAFWSIPTNDLDNLLRVRDGTEWVMEGRSGNRYHVVFRGSPEAGKFRELCLLLLRENPPRTMDTPDLRRDHLPSCKAGRGG